MKVLFIESQKKEKIKTCLHLHFPASLASLSPDLVQCQEHIGASSALHPCGSGEAVSGALVGRSLMGGEHHLIDSKASSPLVQASLFYKVAILRPPFLQMNY